MITSSSTGAATTAALPTSSRQTEQRFSQTSTAAATPRPQCLSAPIIGAEDANTDLADFEYEVFQFRDSLEIARAHFGHAYQSTSPPLPPPRVRECQARGLPLRPQLLRARPPRPRPRPLPPRGAAPPAAAAAKPPRRDSRPRLPPHAGV